MSLGAFIGSTLTKLVPTMYIIIVSGALTLLLVAYGFGRIQGRDETQERQE
ncbi:MAG: hypothetical protein M1275_01165 [Patescibacteria group bacterium]|nr:hypothetical protein [Patescibacteria group bacterium]